MTKPKQASQPPQRLPDPFLVGANVDLSGFPEISESLASDTSDPFLQGDDVHLVAENRNSLKAGILALANQHHDAEVSKHLRAANIQDPTEPKTFYLHGDKATVYLGNDGIFRVTRYQDGKQATVQFRDAKNQEEAQIQAARHFASNTVRIRELTGEEETYLVRLCHLKNFDAAINNYLFFRCGELEFSALEDPRYVEVTNQCAWFVFSNGTPDFVEEARAPMENFLKDRKVLNLEQLQVAFQKFKEEQQRHRFRLLPSEPEVQAPEIDLDALSDEAIEQLTAETLRAHAKQQRR